MSPIQKSIGQLLCTGLLSISFILGVSESSALAQRRGEPPRREPPRYEPPRREPPRREPPPRYEPPRREPPRQAPPVVILPPPHYRGLPRNHFPPGHPGYGRAPQPLPPIRNHPLPPQRSVLMRAYLAPNLVMPNQPFWFTYEVISEQVIRSPYDGRYQAFPEYIVTIYPQLICNHNVDCRNVIVPEPSVLRVTSFSQNNCFAVVTSAMDLDGFIDPIQGITVLDSVGSSCPNANNPYNEVMANIRHRNGALESLSGYRIF